MRMIVWTECGAGFRLPLYGLPPQEAKEMTAVILVYWYHICNLNPKEGHHGITIHTEY